MAVAARSRAPRRATESEPTRTKTQVVPVRKKAANADKVAQPGSTAVRAKRPAKLGKQPREPASESKPPAATAGARPAARKTSVQPPASSASRQTSGLGVSTGGLASGLPAGAMPAFTGAWPAGSPSAAWADAKGTWAQTLDGDPARSFGQSLAGSLQSLVGLSLPHDELERIRAEYVQQATALWNSSMEGGRGTEPLRDPRFAGPDWQQAQWARFTAELYLLNARALVRMADALQGDEKARQRVRFAVQQWAAAASPANYLALNPEAQRKAVETGGKSLEAGLQLLLRDLNQGHLSQTDESVFEVGRNVATSEGGVVYENELFQLIEYRPLTEKVHERPLLIVPPCINKFYILDLQPDNSLVRYANEQGMRVFIVSWVNPGEDLAQKSWDDYVEDGVVRAIREVQGITRQRQINTLGFCIGGTLLGTALAVLKARGEDVASSLTLLASFLDFGKTGVLDIFVDESLVQMREVTLGAQSPSGGALMKGRDLATTFSFLRPTDLVWNYVVGNYLKGELPPAFDLLYWNSDSTNLPGPMYCWYLRHCYLQNELVQPGRLQVCGQPVDLGRLDMPAFVVATREDHIVPWESAYGSLRVLGGERRFVLGASGHIAGIVNPPSKNKRSYWTADLPWPRVTSSSRQMPVPEPRDWLSQVTERPGSWWTGWSQWLKSLSGGLVQAPVRLGDAAHPVLEPAPGRYVQCRA